MVEKIAELDLELSEGDITQKGYEKKKTKLLAPFLRENQVSNTKPEEQKNGVKAKPRQTNGSSSHPHQPPPSSSSATPSAPPAPQADSSQASGASGMSDSSGKTENLLIPGRVSIPDCCSQDSPYPARSRSTCLSRTNLGLAGPTDGTTMRRGLTHPAGRELDTVTTTPLPV